VKFERRDLLKLGAGSAAGLVVSPVPWKLLDDSAIWTQGHMWAAPLSHGPVTSAATVCPLCPEGCATKARLVGGIPVSLGGALCPAGLASHQLAYHPARVKEPVDLARLMEEVRARKGALAILDFRPGRVQSELYQKITGAIKDGLYLTLEQSRPGEIDHAKTVLSFGAPVLDGWGTPGAREFRLIQVEPRASRTASVASDWVPIRPGTEAAFALGIAAVMIAEKRYDAAATAQWKDFAAFQALAAHYAPEAASEISGVAPARIVEVARCFSQEKPAIAIGGGDPGGGPLGPQEEQAIAILNLLNGVPTAGRTAGKGLREVADGSIGALILDGSPQSDALPWRTVQKKLAANAVVVSLSPLRTGLARYAKYQVPAPAPFETWTEFGSDASRWGLTPALMPASQGTLTADTFLTKLAETLGIENPGVLDASLRQRSDSIHRGGRGAVAALGGDAKPVKEVASADDLWKLFSAGAVWSDAKPAAPAKLDGLDTDALLRAAQGSLRRTDEYPLTLLVYGWGHEASEAPVMSKLYEESGLRSSSARVEVHPATGKENGLEDGCAVKVETARGAHRAQVVFNRAVRLGVIEAATRGEPSILDVCDVREDGQWRLSAARIRRA